MRKAVGSLAICGLLMLGCGTEADDGGAASPEGTTATGGETTGETGGETTGETTGETGGDTTGEAKPLEFCAGTTQFLYNPTDPTFLGAFPDDFFTVKNTVNATGLRVNVTPENSAWIDVQVPPNFRANITELNALDGFGTTAGIFLRFDKPVTGIASGFPASLDDTTVRLVAIDGTGNATDLAYTIENTDEDETIIVVPLVPLAPATRHALIVTRNALADDAACIAPGETLKALLTGDTTDEQLLRLVPRWAEALEATGVKADEVSAGVVFTTQSVVDQALTVLEDVQSKTWTWNDGMNCVEKAAYIECKGAFQGWDYRNGKGVVVDGTPQKERTYPATVWMPKGEGPFPTIIYGHGIGGDRSQGAAFAELAASLGMAIAGVDAVQHGQHPAGAGADSQQSVMQFFAINLLTLSIDASRMRDNWRQSTFDKLQLTHLLVDSPDIDGDGLVDIDTDRLAYLGVSLGGIMGSELLALTDHIGAGVLDVCGGRLSQIMKDSAMFGLFLQFAVPQDTPPGDVDRFFTLAQTLIERADPANFAPYLLEDRLPGTGERLPQMLMQIAMGDETIPNSTSWYLARAMNLPQLHPVAQHIEVVPQQETLPATGNVSLDVSGGIFQFDRVSFGNPGSPSATQHNNTPGSAESLTQMTHFLQTFFNDGVSEILDPYAVIGTSKL